ncbi:hypothetical protein ACJRO7_026213 [Eucalyptus globulus]|uniref:Uncharacterized protein n=1 Tax=Eucalyptus globulus TaxID=34317 RepID=A0ABD3KCL9_EUCGL
MSSCEQAIVSLLSNFALSFDSEKSIMTLAYAVVRTIVKFTSSSSTLHKLQDVPSVRPDSSSRSGTKDLMIARGLVEAKSAVEGGTWKSLRQNVLVSQDCDTRAVIVQRTQTISVPFVVIDGSQWLVADYVVVNMDGSRFHLPLTTLCHQLQLTNYSLLTHSSRHFLVIRSCKDFPYFFTKTTKDQMIIDLALFWSSILLGKMSIGILDVLDGWLRVICLMRRRRSVFVPCDHLVSPKCSVCKKPISNSIQILEYGSDFVSVSSRVES